MAQLLSKGFFPGPAAGLSSSRFMACWKWNPRGFWIGRLDCYHVKRGEQGVWGGGYGGKGHATWPVLWPSFSIVSFSTAFSLRNRNFNLSTLHACILFLVLSFFVLAIAVNLKLTLQLAGRHGTNEKYVFMRSFEGVLFAFFLSWRV